MRYRKGGIDLKSAQDTLLLQTVLRSRHVSHEQLWQFMQYKAREHRRRVFNWRLKRLVDHELVVRTPTPERSWVYSMSQEGAEHLVSQGDSGALLVTGGFVEFDDRTIQHSLGLNRIHLALLRADVLTTWQSDLEIRSLNELTRYGFPKDYDAVVQVERGGCAYRFALEYERSAKTPARYRRVREVVEKESRLDCVVYLLPAYPLLSYVAKFFERCSKPIYFALSNDFEKDTLDTMVMDSHRVRSIPLWAVLDAKSRNGAGASAVMPSR
jgi:protein involved in plasmid replication-relaxation